MWGIRTSVAEHVSYRWPSRTIISFPPHPSPMGCSHVGLRPRPWSCSRQLDRSKRNQDGLHLPLRSGSACTVSMDTPRAATLIRLCLHHTLMQQSARHTCPIAYLPNWLRKQSSPSSSGPILHPARCAYEHSASGRPHNSAQHLTTLLRTSARTAGAAGPAQPRAARPPL